MKQISIIFTAAVLLLAACASEHYTFKEEFSVDRRSPTIEIGTIEAQFDRMMGIAGLRKYEVTVNYYPIEDVVGLQYRVNLMTYNQFWSKRGRDVFISAIEKYKDDFSQKNLARNKRKNKKQYGILQGFLTWQASNLTMRSYGHPDIELGYYFKDTENGKAPFFSTNQRSVLSEGVSSSDTRQTHDIMIFYTIAQADELAALFDSVYLQGFSRNEFGEPIIFELDEDINIDDY